jgi:antitoxin CcdA
MNHFAASPKKTTSVSLAESLLIEARSLGINVSQAAEEGLAKAVALKREARWIEENRDAIQSSNEFVERQGLPLEKYRMF